jgi:hypothetical protein
VKLPAGPLKLIFVSRSSVVENRDRMAVRGAKMVPSWIIVVHTPAVEEGGVEVTPAKTEVHNAHTFKAATVTPKVDFRGDKPYPWLPSVRPGFPNESLKGLHIWLETKDELNIDIKERFNG